MAGRYHSLLRRLGRYRWFSAVGARLAPVDRWLDRTTRGRVRLGGGRSVPQLLLTTTGRRTGRPRTTPLLYACVDGDWVVTATNWGQEHHPAWSTNLIAHPEATIDIGATRVEVDATLAGGAERDRLWAALLDVWPAYAAYAERSERDIRVFRLRRSR